MIWGVHNQRIEYGKMLVELGDGESGYCGAGSGSGKINHELYI